VVELELQGKFKTVC